MRVVMGRMTKSMRVVMGLMTRSMMNQGAGVLVTIPGKRGG